MAITLEANYSKKLGLPAYSSHQYAITVRTEVNDLSQVQQASSHLYRQLQEAVDRDIQQTDCRHDREIAQSAFTAAYNAPEEAAEHTDADAPTANPDKGVRIMDAYLDSEHGQMPELPLGVEVQLEEDFAEFPSPVLGYIDLVRTGNVPVDYKTCASCPDLALEAFQHEVQLTLYQLLIESATGDTVAGRELVFLVKTKMPKVIVHRLPPATKQQK